MGFIDRLRGELIDIIEWTDDTRDTIVWRFPRHENEIKMDAKLVVRESQVAVFVNEGTIADVFAPGTHTLETRNLPILSTLKGWKYGFERPFKAEVYFCQHPAVHRPEVGHPEPGHAPRPGVRPGAGAGVRHLRLPGRPTRRCCCASWSAPTRRSRTDEVDEFIRQSVVTRVGDAPWPTSGVAVLDLAAHQNEIADRLAVIISEDLKHLGLELPRFVIENVSLPPEVEAAMDTRTQMGVLGDLDRFTRYQAATAITEAAANPGGLAGAGVGVGVGASLGAQLAQALAPGATPTAAPTARHRCRAAPSGTWAWTVSRSARWPRPRSRRG